MSRAKIIDHYLEKLNDPDFSIIEIRRELKRANIPEEEISIIFRIIDNEMQRRLLRKHKVSTAASLQWLGAVVFGIGFIITAGTYLGIIPSGRYSVVMLGPMGFGAALFLYGLAKK